MYLSNETLNYSSYETAAPTVEAYIADFYNETVTTDSLAYIEVATSNDICYDSAGYISGTVVWNIYLHD